MLPPCACGGIAEVEQVGLDRWLVRCRSCGAIVVETSEEKVTMRFTQGQLALVERDLTKLKFTNGEVRACCKDPHNLILTGPKDDITIYVCKVCQRRHRRLRVDPGRLGLRERA